MMDRLNAQNMGCNRIMSNNYENKKKFKHFMMNNWVDKKFATLINTDFTNENIDFSNLNNLTIDELMYCLRCCSFLIKTIMEFTNIVSKQLASVEHELVSKNIFENMTMKKHVLFSEESFLTILANSKKFALQNRRDIQTVENRQEAISKLSSELTVLREAYCFAETKLLKVCDAHRISLDL